MISLPKFDNLLLWLTEPRETLTCYSLPSLTNDITKNTNEKSDAEYIGQGLEGSQMQDLMSPWSLRCTDHLPVDIFTNPGTLHTLCARNWRQNPNIIVKDAPITPMTQEVTRFQKLYARMKTEYTIFLTVSHLRWTDD